MKSRSLQSIVVAAIGIATPGIALQSLGAELYSVDFTAEPVTGMTGPAARGHTGADFWNTWERKSDPFIGFIGSGTISNIKNVEGTSSSIDIAVNNAPGAWGNGHPDHMMSGYLYSFDGGNITIDLLEVPSGKHDLLLYGHGGDAGSPTSYDAYNSIFSVEANGISYGQKATGTDSVWLGTTWVEGAQFVLFDDVEVGPDGKISIQVAAGGGREPYLSGLQLELARAATVPDSDLTAVSMAVGFLALLGVRRRAM